MTSTPNPDRAIDLDRDVPVTPADVAALRQARRELPSWLDLEYRELEAVLPQDALDRRPTAKAAWRPFTLD